MNEVEATLAVSYLAKRVAALEGQVRAAEQAMDDADRELGQVLRVLRAVAKVDGDLVVMTALELGYQELAERVGPNGSNSES